MVEALKKGKKMESFFDQATMRRRPSNLLVGVWNPAHQPTTDALVVNVLAAYFVMMCCGLSTGTQRASGILGVWDFPSWPNIVLAFMHSPSVE
jgi:hypothetical protein